MNDKPEVVIMDGFEWDGNCRIDPRDGNKVGELTPARFIVQVEREKHISK